MKTPLRILQLEDDPNDAELIKVMLETEDIICHITRVENRADFLTLLEQGGIDIILADYTLPSFDGLSALRISQEKYPYIPYIFVTGTLGEEVAIEALKSGATDYVLKERLSRLVPSVRRALREAKERAERERTEEELRRSEVYLAEAQRLTHTGSWAYNALEIVYWSEEMFRIFGFDPQEGYPSADEFFERIHPEDRDWLRERIYAVLDEKVEHVHDHRIVLPDGSVKHIHAIGHPVLNNAGDVVEIVGTLVDITERKRAEEALQKSQAELAHIARVSTLGEMMASIAHEINQPLSAVVNNASACLRWLKAQNLDEARRSATLVIADGHRASEIIGRIRALAKKAPLQKGWLDINDALREVIDLIYIEVQRNDVSLQTQLSGDLPLILGDRIQLQQVILNLIMNAIEAMSTMEEGPRELWVSSDRAESGDILIAVRDLGPGLDPKSLVRFFDAFYTTKPQGLGIGLAISRSIVEAHGGRLWATSNVPHGAVFQFTLPIGSGKVS